MPSISVGANYTIVDENGGLVSASFPYKRTLKPEYSPNESLYPSAFLLFWVKTGYTSNAEAASVRIDSKEIGKIYPRPWLNHNIVDLEADIIVFDSKLIEVGGLLNPRDHTLEIVPGKSYLLLGVVLCGYHQT